jgi:gliding motility-associated-like protein
MLCPNRPLTIKPTTIGINYNRYLWSNGSTDDSIIVLLPGLYKLTAWDNCNYQSSDSILVLKPDFSLTISPSQHICKGDSAILTASPGYISYNWSPTNSLSSPNNFFTTAFPKQTTCYSVSATKFVGCVLTDTTIITVVDCPTKIYFPTAFTPNNDGRNDVYKPIIEGDMIKYHFSVYNRFGQKIFETSQPQNGWNGIVNGLLQQTGSYIWLCEYQFKNQLPKQAKGSLLLIR